MLNIKLYTAVAAIFLLLLLSLFLIGMIGDFPVLMGTDAPQQYLEAVENQAKGIYSQKLPLIPVFVRITEFDREAVYYRIYYFPFGSMDMSYHLQDGYNIEKSLSRI